MGADWFVACCCSKMSFVQYGLGQISAKPDKTRLTECWRLHCEHVDIRVTLSLSIAWQSRYTWLSLSLVNLYLLLVGSLSWRTLFNTLLLNQTFTLGRTTTLWSFENQAAQLEWHEPLRGDSGYLQSIHWLTAAVVCRSALPCVDFWSLHPNLKK